MLRHIISVSLAMAACAALIPTKVNAATLTVTPSDSLQKKTGDSITFSFLFNPAPENATNLVKLQSLNFSYDNSELSFDHSQSFVAFTDTIVNGTPTIRGFVNNTQTIVSLTFNVLQPLKDGKSDLFDAFAWYQIGDLDPRVKTTLIADGSFDVEPVPEPVTIFGTATALACGFLFKRKSSKKTVG
jgi:hypothetical protein